MTRISGTATDGVWQGSVRVSSAYIGRWFGHLGGIEDVNGNSSFNEVPTNEFQIGAPGQLPWKAVRADPPLRVVDGSGSWTPRLVVVDRTTGQAIPGAFLDSVGASRYEYVPAQRATRPSLRADAAGVWTGPPTALYRGYVPLDLLASRGTSGFSLEGRGCYSGPTVKWQANERFSVSGRTITASGNAFPAPKIHHAHNPSIRLEYLVGRTWRQAALSTVHPSGRYSISWTAPQAGVVAVRVVKPGGVGECESSVGSVLPSVELTAR